MLSDFPLHIQQKVQRILDRAARELLEKDIASGRPTREVQITLGDNARTDREATTEPERSTKPS